MVFPDGGPEPRHPSQLYEALLEGIVLFIVLRILTNRLGKLRQPGFVSGAFAAGYGVARTFVEFFREPDIQIGYLAGGLTMGMLLSIPMIVAGVALMLWVVAAEAGGDPGRVTPLGDEDRGADRGERADHGRRLHGALPRRPRARLLHGPRAVRPRRRFRHRARGQPDLRRADRPLGGGDLAGDGRRRRPSSSPSSVPAAAR